MLRFAAGPADSDRAGSGYLSQGELYRLGLVTTLMLAAIYLLIGTPWLMLVVR